MQRYFERNPSNIPVFLCVGIFQYCSALFHIKRFFSNGDFNIEVFSNV